MADKDIPFDEDMMTLIMGVDASDKPGQHGRTLAPAPDKGAIDLVTEIRDMCEDFLMAAGKRGPEESKEDKNMDNEEEE